MVITANRPEFAGTADLLTRARAGEAAAFCQLATEHEGRLLQQACGLSVIRARPRTWFPRRSSRPGAASAATMAPAASAPGCFPFSCTGTRRRFAAPAPARFPSPRCRRLRPTRAAKPRRTFPAAGLSPAEEAMRKEAADNLRQAVEGLAREASASRPAALL